MASNHKIPLRVTYNNETPTGIAEYQSVSGECIPVDFGGTGQNDISRGEIIVGDITDKDFKAKKFTDSSGNLTCIFDETWLVGTDQPINQTSGSSSQFYAGETVYQGTTVENAVASGIVIENTAISSTFKLKSIIGTFTTGSVIWADTTFPIGHSGYAESNEKREATLLSTSEAIVEQSTMSFLLGTLDSTLGENVIDCGTIA